MGRACLKLPSGSSIDFFIVTLIINHAPLICLLFLSLSLITKEVVAKEVDTLFLFRGLINIVDVPDEVLVGVNFVLIFIVVIRHQRRR